MVRRGVTAAIVALVAFSGCERQEEMAESVEMSDTTAVHRALEEAGPRGALLDTMPGGEMAIGDSAAEMELLRDKMTAQP